MRNFFLILTVNPRQIALKPIKTTHSSYLPQAGYKPVLDPDSGTGLVQYGVRRISTRGGQSSINIATCGRHNKYGLERKPVFNFDLRPGISTAYIYLNMNVSFASTLLVHSTVLHFPVYCKHCFGIMLRHIDLWFIV